MLKKFASLMPAWVVAAGVAGYLHPPALTVFRPWLVWLFIGTMLGVGCAMNPGDFRPLIKQPVVVLLGVLAQFLIMPACGFLIGKMLHLPPELLLGMVLVGAVPGAMASNVIAYLANTDVAYSIALTSLATLLAPILTPALTYCYMHTVVHIDFWKMFLSIIQMVIAPLLVGFALKHYFRRRIERMHDLFPALSTMCIAIICGTVVAVNRETIASLTMIVFAAVILHNLAGYGGGYAVSKLFRFDPRRARTLAVEVGMQNAGLGALLALNQFAPETAIIPAVFATWCVITASCLARYWNGKTEKRPQSA